MTLVDILFGLFIAGLVAFYGVKIARGYPKWRADRAVVTERARDRKDRMRQSREVIAARLARDKANPPWVEPRAIDSTMNTWAYDALRQRLDLVEDRTEAHALREYWRDRETGQYWVHYEDEVGFNQFNVLAPIKAVPRQG